MSKINLLTVDDIKTNSRHDVIVYDISKIIRALTRVKVETDTSISYNVYELIKSVSTARSNDDVTVSLDLSTCGTNIQRYYVYVDPSDDKKVLYEDEGNKGSKYRLDHQIDNIFNNLEKYKLNIVFFKKSSKRVHLCFEPYFSDRELSKNMVHIGVKLEDKEICKYNVNIKLPYFSKMIYYLETPMWEDSKVLTKKDMFKNKIYTSKNEKVPHVNITRFDILEDYIITCDTQHLKDFMLSNAHILSMKMEEFTQCTSSDCQTKFQQFTGRIGVDIFDDTPKFKNPFYFEETIHTCDGVKVKTINAVNGLKDNSINGIFEKSKLYKYAKKNFKHVRNKHPYYIGCGYQVSIFEFELFGDVKLKLFVKTELSNITNEKSIRYFLFASDDDVKTPSSFINEELKPQQSVFLSNFKYTNEDKVDKFFEDPYRPSLSGISLWSNLTLGEHKFFITDDFKDFINIFKKYNYKQEDFLANEILEKYFDFDHKRIRGFQHTKPVIFEFINPKETYKIYPSQNDLNWQKYPYELFKLWYRFQYIEVQDFVDERLILTLPLEVRIDNFHYEERVFDNLKVKHNGFRPYYEQKTYNHLKGNMLLSDEYNIFTYEEDEDKKKDSNMVFGICIPVLNNHSEEIEREMELNPMGEEMKSEIEKLVEIAGVGTYTSKKIRSSLRVGDSFGDVKVSFKDIAELIFSKKHKLSDSMINCFNFFNTLLYYENIRKIEIKYIIDEQQFISKRIWRDVQSSLTKSTLDETFLNNILTLYTPLKKHRLSITIFGKDTLEFDIKMDNLKSIYFDIDEDSSKDISIIRHIVDDTKNELKVQTSADAEILLRFDDDRNKLKFSLITNEEE